MITPHGGKLVNKVASDEEKKELIAKSSSMLHLDISLKKLCDVELIAFGAFSPLSGFMNKRDYQGVVENMRLEDGTVWPMPVTFSVDEETASKIKEGQEVALNYEGKVIAILKVEEKYEYNKNLEAKSVFKTTDTSHPGVTFLFSQDNLNIAGEITLVDSFLHQSFPNALIPEESRSEFELRNWQQIVAFQTRNPTHRAHEYLLKSALEISDGIFFHPLVGHTKKDDIPSNVRMSCYLELIKNYFPKNRVLLSPFPAAMRYAGPREALFHAIVRKNYGCSHFIVGRDHAGVNNFYGPFEAQKIFSEFRKDEIGITPLFFDNAFYCYRCESMATSKTCPHGEKEHLILSGTRARQMLKDGEKLPHEFTRPEISILLQEWIFNSEKSEVIGMSGGDK